MKSDPMQDKTAVFSFGSLNVADEPRSYDLDEPTRELPLIAGRFAGREWDAEDLRREFSEKETLTGRVLRRRRAATLAIGALCAMFLVVMSLLGQARLVDMNEQTSLAIAEVAELRREHNELVIAYEQTRLRAGGGDVATGESRVQLLRQAQSEIAPNEAEDVVTVLNVRRGREFHHFWQSLVDTLGVSFR